MSLELKIKSKHLSVEAQIIRFEEKKLLRQIKWLKEAQNPNRAAAAFSQWNSLNSHRRRDVRFENRATFLARAFLSNKPYIEVEAKRSDDKEYDFRQFVIPRIVSMVNKYGTGNARSATAETIKKWATN